MISQIYPTELQFNKANPSDTEAPLFGLQFVHNKRHSFNKNYDKQDDFNTVIVNFPFLDGDVPSSPSYGVYI